VDAEFVIFGSVTNLGGWYNLDLAIVDLTKDKPKTTRIPQSVAENNVIPALRDVAHQFRSIIDGVDFNQQKLPGNNQQEPSSTNQQKPSSANQQEPSGTNQQELSGQSNLPEDQPSMGLFFKATNEGREATPVGEASFRMKIMSFDTGDLDGDGKTELIFMTRQKILIYHRNNKVLTLIDSYKGSGSEFFFAISVGDADNNGRDEMYVDASYGDRARTTVIEWRGKGQFHSLFKKTGHIRIVRDQGGGLPVLLYQDSVAVGFVEMDDIGQVYDRFFQGWIYQVRYDGKGNQLSKQPVAGFGKGSGKGPQLHTLIRYDLNHNGKPEYIGLGKEYSQLTVWNANGMMLWRGKKEMGGTNNAFQGDADSPSVLARIAINAPPTITDVDDDGKPELLAIKNITLSEVLSNFLIYTKGKLLAYKMEGTNLSPVWATKEFEGSIAGVCSVDKTLYLAMLEGEWPTTMWSKGSSRVKWFEQ